MLTESGFSECSLALRERTGVSVPCFIGLTAAMMLSIASKFAFAADPHGATGAPPKLVWRPVRPGRSEAAGGKAG